LLAVALPRYHLSLEAWVHGAFAREMPYFPHLMDISALINR